MPVYYTLLKPLLKEIKYNVLFNLILNHIFYNIKVHSFRITVNEWHGGMGMINDPSF